jgi:hypothetical protein
VDPRRQGYVGTLSNAEFEDTPGIRVSHKRKPKKKQSSKQSLHKIHKRTSKALQVHKHTSEHTSKHTTAHGQGCVCYIIDRVT